MAERIVSPGVFTREKDLSFLPQGISEIGAAIVGPTKQGPSFVPTVIRNFEEFEKVSGLKVNEGKTNFMGGILEALLTLKVTAKPRFSSQLQILAANLFTKDCYLSSDVSNRLTLKVTAKLIPSPLKLRANDFNLVFSKLC